MLGKDVPAPDEFTGSQEAASDEPSWDVACGDDDPEFDRIDQLYRQVLQAMDEVESGLDMAVPADSASAQSNVPPKSHGEPSPVSSRVFCADDTAHSPDQPAPGRIAPRQIIEAALFVGGKPLTSKALCALLRGDFDPSFVEETVDDLNSQYADDNRPYTIQFGEGGYRMTLRPEYERLHHRVYGIGPKEIKLSQDALEVLACVAYKQPITRQQIEELGKPNAGALLRQLLRRELIALQRDPDDSQTVTYHTTQRFLAVFGIGRLDELPQADELSFK